MRNILLAVALFLAPALAVAQTPTAWQYVSSDDVVVTLTYEECALTEQITNLPLRATWQEDGVTNEGCYSIWRPGIVSMYFDDKTVVVAMFSAFKPVTRL